MYYKGDKIRSKNCRFNIILGKRSKGKSYDFKEFALYDYFKNPEKNRFILLRRFVEEVKTDKMEKYFSDNDIVKITEGKYDCISCFKGAFYLSNLTSDFKIKRGEKIGYYIPLAQEQNFASVSFLDVNKIIFEEFMSRSVYLYNEPKKLMNIYSTVDRNEQRVKMYMLGNTITKICPYFNEWKIDRVLREMKPGDIRLTKVDGQDFAIEYTDSESDKASGTIGTIAKMIDTGVWDADNQPHLEFSYKQYKVLFRVGFDFKNNKFLGELLKSPNNVIIWFIKPYNKDFNNLLVFSDKIKENKLYQTSFYNNVNIKNSFVLNSLNLFTEDKIFYSSDSCGTDFKQAINFTIKK